MNIIVKENQNKQLKYERAELEGANIKYRTYGDLE